MGVSLIAGMLAPFVLKDVAAGSSSSVPPEIEIAVGALVLAVVAAVRSGLAARWRDRRKRSKATELGSSGGPDAPVNGATVAGTEAPRAGFPGSQKLPLRLRGALENGSPWVALLVDVAHGMPGAHYLATIAIMLKSHSAPPIRMTALVLFNIFLFAIAIVPLALYASNPAATQRSVAGLHDWVGTHRRLVVASVAGVIGASLVIRGITKL
ncbi:MAG TPA: GAP family protein [Solirubrobacteraceae bacterium]|nr:GAP family protein [Solirubrobacteraceae bacterium]